MKRGSHIFELFGYPVDAWNGVAAKNLARCICPFMGAECDGGGNRYSSGIDLSKNVKLGRHFPGKRYVQSGVCSLQLKPHEQPWIVCPRRLLNYRHCDMSKEPNALKEKLHAFAGLHAGCRYSVWSEVKMKCNMDIEGREALFDYTFDYVIAGSRRLRLEDAARIVGKSVDETKEQLDALGFTSAYRDGVWFCEDFPATPFVVVEVMTSSTSGGNKARRTQISQLFEDTVYRLAGETVDAAGPGINYRQVWARMVSQLLVKSQISTRWGGKTIWVLQDLLADYISKTTALNIHDFAKSCPDEVNVISGGYGQNVCPAKRKGDFASIDDIRTYAGPVSSSKSGGKSFSDIIKLGSVPDVSELWRHLAGKRPCARLAI